MPFQTSPLWKTNCKEAPTNIRSQVQNWFPQMKLYTGPRPGKPPWSSFACVCARLIFRGGSLRHCKICGPISQDSHVQGTHSYRESQRGAGRTKTVKRVNTAEGQERVTRQGLCFTGDADVTNVENIFAIWRRVRLSWLGDPLLLSKLQQPHVRFWQIYSRYRGATHGNTTRCVTFLAALQRRPVTRSKIDSSHLLDKNGTGGRKLFLGTMPIALLATRALWKGREEEEALLSRLTRRRKRGRERLIVSGGRADPSISSGCARETIKRMIRLQERGAGSRAL